MKLTGINSFGPIKPFDTIELPAFSVIIGPNGVGKSQLLQAIKGGSVVVGEPPATPAMHMPSPTGSAVGIVLLANSDALPAFGNAQSPNQVNAGSMMAGGLLHQKMAATQSILNALAADLALGEVDIAPTGQDPWILGPDALARKFHFEPGSPMARRIETAFEEADKALLVTGPNDRRPTDQSLPLLRSISQRMRIRPTQVSQAMLAENSIIGSFSIFAPNIENVIAFYRDKLSNNRLARLNDEPCLDTDAFEALYGPPPWAMIDDVLHDFGLAYTVVKPVFASPPPAYSLAFQRLVGSPIPPQAISSGEKVLLRFALAILSYDPLRVMLDQPSLLLLDEMDASLHPQVLNRWIETLRDEFVGKRGLNCILTTHSPITVALAPEDAIFELAEGDPVPRSISKQQALNRLTVGLPTLSVSYSGQRQVFVESDSDADIFTKINATLKKAINLPRSLSFISTGYRNKNNVEQNAGCTVVTSVTEALRASGNHAVFGLVDWDGGRRSSESVKVIAEGTHYTLENVLLDPLLIGSLLLRDTDVRFPNDINFIALAEKDPKIHQAVVNFVQFRIKYPNNALSGCQTVKYLNAPSVTVDTAFILTPGHEIEVLLANAFQYLGQFAKNRGTMMNEVVSRVLPLYPGLCPMPIVEAFRTISNQDSH